MPLIRRTFPVGALGCNCTMLACPETREALVIDPGDDAADILADLARDGLTAVKLLHTHAHFDHVMATADVAAATGAEVMLHRDDRWLYDRTLMQIEAFGGFRRPDGQPWHPPPPPTRELTGDEACPSDAARRARCTRPVTRRGRRASTSSGPDRRGQSERAARAPCCWPGTRSSRGRSGARICGAGRWTPSGGRSASGCSRYPTTRW